MYVLGITEEEHREQDLAIGREMLSLKRTEIERARQQTFWSIMGTIASVGIPIATFLGLEAYFRRKVRGRKK